MTVIETAAVGDRTARIDRALGYPYHAPRESYLYIDGDVRPISQGNFEDLRSRRLAVLAFGSNRAPWQLALKYAGWPSGTAIPVTRATLTGWDVVYGSHVTSYGSVPAALHPSPGTSVAVAITWLTDEQLLRMHETEGSANYAFSPLEDADIAVDDVPVADLGDRTLVHFYRPLNAPLTSEGEPTALSAVHAVGRRWRALDQRQIQGEIRDRLAPGQPLDDFVWEAIADPAVRTNRTALMRAMAAEFAGQP